MLLLDNTYEIFIEREIIFDAFRDGTFPSPIQSEKESNQSENDEEPYTPQETPRDMPALESEESGAQRSSQLGQGLKILALNQIRSRLSITLAQFKVENKSQKLKSEIRLLLYSLYRSKILTKTIYNNLINAI